MLDEFAGVLVDEAAAEHCGVEGEELFVGDEREVAGRERTGSCCGGAGVGPVSYTHLDVYKRQVVSSLHRLGKLARHGQGWL